MVCTKNSSHFYPDHLSSCPWCARQKQLGGLDPFPSQSSVQSGKHTSAPVGKSPPKPAPVPTLPAQVPPTPQAQSPQTGQSVLLNTTVSPTHLFNQPLTTPMTSWFDLFVTTLLGSCLGAILGMHLNGGEYPNWLPGQWRERLRGFSCNATGASERESEIRFVGALLEALSVGHCSAR